MARLVFGIDRLCEDCHGKGTEHSHHYETERDHKGRITHRHLVPCPHECRYCLGNGVVRRTVDPKRQDPEPSPWQ